MSSNVLSSLANKISDQYGAGSTQTNALNVLQNGNNIQSQTLGDFSKQFSQVEERKYLEEGYLRKDPWNVLPKSFEVLFQEPDITVLVKKRAFSTLAENHRPDYMDADEKLFYKASKILFQNKCKQIAALEKLSKIDRVSSTAGYLDAQFLPIIIGLVDVISPGFSTSPLSEENDFLDSQASEPFKKLTNVINQIRQAYAFSADNVYTTWITDDTNPFKSDFSQGTGVIEFTNVTNVSTNISTGLAAGTFSLRIADPYKAMTITNSDIEWALLDALNAFNNSAIFQLGKSSLDRVAADAINTLNNVRKARAAGTIEFITNSDLPAGTQVSAIIENIGEAINFTYNPIPNLGSLLSGGGVTVAPESLQGGPLVEDDGLSPAEIPLFANVVSSLYNSIQFKVTSQTNIAQNSQLTNYARRKLRFHYASKPIIQAMDQVHIFIGSKTRTDDKIMGGLQNMFSGLGFLQNLNNNVFELKNQINTLFNPSQNIDLQLEKTIFVGSNFPTALWVMMRNLFVNDKNGCSVFGGVVGTANRTFDSSSGSWYVSVNGKDNATYLEYGVVNLKPGVDQFNGSLYDPLTQFETRFDSISSNFNNEKKVLLAENQALLSANNGMMKFKGGRNAGQNVTLDNFFEDKEIIGSGISGNGISRDIYYAPDGFVYKWKEGIGLLVQFGDSFNNNNLGAVGIPKTNEPLAGQDVMNVLSLYITGIPYNYATYYNTVNVFDQLNRNPQSNASAANSYYATITNDLKKNNLLWGDFIPFKGLVVDEQTYIKMIDSKLTIQNTNTQIDQILQQIQDTSNKLYVLQKGGAQTAPATVLLKNQLDNLNQQLSDQKKAITNTLTNSAIPLSVIGNDVSFNPDQLEDSLSFSLSSPQTRRELRRRINFLTRRLQWQVRANQDKNLFIVDDSYDKDYDITAFETSLLSQLAQYSSEFTSVKEKVANVAQLLSLEVFCNTQGHIVVRPQQYNRVPSSVFYRMLQLKQQTGIQIFPQFLEDLFVTNIKNFINSIKVIEDQIRLDGAILGLNDDQSIVNFLRSPSITTKDNTSFNFVSDDTDGVITDVSKIVDISDPDSADPNTNTFVSKLTAQNSVTSVFTINKRATVVQQSSNNTSQLNTTFSSDRINALQNRLKQETGQAIQIDNFQQTTINSVLATPTNNVDIVKLTNDISDKLSTRQQLIKKASSAIKNATEAKSLDAGDNKTANELLFPDLYGNKDVPEIFANMIEDESYDDFGPGSGSRYVIRNYQIKSLSIHEEPPEFTMIEVQGMIDPIITNNTLPSGLVSFPKGGNGMITAAAVDYDLWRMYGYRAMSSVHVPFLANPQAQCAPYAASLLSRARRNILRAELTISGNEYMQPGEVVYIEDEDLLFYVESVAHDFSYGSTFTTRLQLSYGHTAGEYIPTPTDVIGKMLYNITSPNGTNSVNYRQNSIFNETKVGAIIINPSDTTTSTAGPTDIITAGTYGSHNIQIIQDILLKSSAFLNTNNVSASNVTPILELRVFYDGKAGSANSSLTAAADILQSILTGNTTIDSTSTNPNTKQPHLSDSSVKKVEVDISAQDEHRSPTQDAWDLARNSANSASIAPPEAITDAQQTQAVISSVIIDCVMVFNNSNNSANTGSPNNTNNANTVSS